MTSSIFSTAFTALALAGACVLPLSAAIAAQAFYKFQRSVTGLVVTSPTQAQSIALTLTASELPPAKEGIPYSFDLKTLLTVEGDGAYSAGAVSWGVVSNSLPNGLYLTTDGYIGGTPTTSGTGEIRVQASYKTATGEQSYQVIAVALSVNLASSVLPDAKEGVPYSVDLKPLLTVDGGNAYSAGDIQWSVISSTLPAGLGLSQDGHITGTPTASGNGEIRVRASYKTANGEQSYQVVTVALTVGLSSAQLPAATVGANYTYDFKPLLTSNDPNFAPASVTFTATGLPSGLSLSNYGALSGTPSVKNEAGSSFQVTARYNNKEGQQGYTLVVNGVTLRVTQFASGSGHTCAVTVAGGVKCWGNNANGQLGDNSTTARPSPTDVSGLTSGVKYVATNDNHSCAVMVSGTVKCWGANPEGQFGNNSKIGSRVPVDVPGLSAVASVHTGLNHTCAIMESGTAKCWGLNTSGQLGMGHTVSLLTPADVKGLTEPVKSLATGSTHTCAVTQAGAAKCWGIGGPGVLGNGSTSMSSSPVNVTGLQSGVAKVAGIAQSVCALTDAGAVYCWGAGSSGQLGNGSTTASSTPVAVAGLNTGVAHISVSGAMACAALTNGQLKCWGSNSYGQTGDGVKSAMNTTPVLAQGLNASVLQSTTGSDFACAVTSSNGVKCWGRSNNGQLGNGVKTDSLTPVDVLP